ncbi:MAG TPA: leucyl aminopeptidase [Thermoanaerobaculia bacterium]|jgi:leucyl aminopeptidase
MQLEISNVIPRGAGVRRVALLLETGGPAAGAPPSTAAALSRACRAAAFRGKEKEITVAAGKDGPWILAGIGKAPATSGRLRRAVRRAAREAFRPGATRVAFLFDRRLSETDVRALLPAIAGLDYRFDRYRSRGKAGASKVRGTIVVGPDLDRRRLLAAAHEASVTAEAAAWARDLGNTPANDLGPEEFAAAVQAMGKKRGLPVQVFDKKRIEQERLAGLLAVNSGSVRPPRLVIAEYKPDRSKGTAVFVGKGITFDSGGISIKPSASMGEMKYDMMGAATVFAVLQATSRLRLPVRVVALAPVTENLPSGSACRPGDILRMRNGLTVEVDNTDAEGRLVLADVLDFAAGYEPDVIVDFATLTGAVLVALGSECAGVMTPDDRLAGDLVAAGEAVGERLWRLPLWDEYLDNLKSDWADMKNTGGRNAGTINGGIFLKQFAPKGAAWAHIDFAGVAHLEKEQAGFSAGATGFGVALSVEFLKRRFES